jgi:hypothetical protein
MALRQVSPERKTAYYVGLAMQVVGGLCFGSVFVSVAIFMSQANGFPRPQHGPSFLPAVIGMGLLIVGGLIRRAGQLGLAGSGIELDPERARKDVEPWARMGGGVLKDALDEAGIAPGGKSGAVDALPFDERLRRLEKLREEGLVNEQEFAAAKKKILDGA